MDKLFFVIFNSYYKDNQFKNDNPPLTVGGLFFGLYVTFYYCYILYLDIETRQGPTDSAAILLGFLSVLTTYFVFFGNRRYMTIYEKYKDDIALRSKTTKFFCFFLVFFLILSSLFLIAIRNKLVFGNWI